MHHLHNELPEQRPILSATAIDAMHVDTTVRLSHIDEQDWVFC